MSAQELSGLLREAVFEYQYVTPDGDEVWCPFVLNNMPCLPNPDTDILKRRGAGKVTSDFYQAAAEYTYGQITPEDLKRNTVAEAIRLRLTNGSLPNDSYNYTGIDCSGLLCRSLARGLSRLGVDLYDHIRVPYEDVEAGYRIPGWRPDLSKQKEVLERAREERGLTVKTFTETFHEEYDPVRAINIKRLIYSSDLVEDETPQPADLAIYTPGDPSILGHTALVLGTVGSKRVKFAHSGRRDPRIERGGVEFFTLPRHKVFDRKLEHGHRGSMSIRRLAVLSQLDAAVVPSEN